MKRRPVLYILIPYILVIFLWDMFLPTFFIRNHYRKYIAGEGYQILIKEEPVERQKTYRLTGEIIACSVNNQWQSTCGNILLYFRKTDSSSVKTLRYGDVIETDNTITEIENFTPEFDFKTFNRHRRIYDNLFITERNFVIVSHNKGNYLIRSAKRLNNLLQSRINNSKLEEREKQLAIGLLLGDKTVMNEDIIRSFRSVGLAHILSVSGLHIGILLLLLSSILNIFYIFSPKVIIIKNILLILAALGLCFLVGLPAPAIRVAVMLIVLFVSQNTARNNDKTNILLLTALIFLIFNPLILFDWSFQFSFLAVLGLVVFEKWKKRIEYKTGNNIILKNIVSTALITLTAQAFVYPLTLFRFRQFYIYSVLSNLIIVPMLSVVMVTTILFLAMYDWHWAGSVMEYLLHYELWLMIRIVEFIDGLPFANLTF